MEMKLTTDTSNLIEFDYMPGEKVVVDGDVTGYITEISVVEGPLIKYKVEWFQQGTVQYGWFSRSRLRFAP